MFYSFSTLSLTFWTAREHNFNSVSNCGLEEPEEFLWGDSRITKGFASVPTTPEPNTSAKVSRYKWERYRDTNWWCIYDFLPRKGHTFAKNIAIQTGGVSRYFSKVSGSGVHFTLLRVSEKSTLWTDTGVDQNFQRDLGAIGPYEFQGEIVWTNGPFASFSGKFAWQIDTEKFIKSFPLQGRAKGDAPKVTEPNLRFPAVFLRKYSVFCENLRFSAVSCALQMLEFPPEGVDLRKSAVLCENLRFGLSLSLCHLTSVP